MCVLVGEELAGRRLGLCDWIDDSARRMLEGYILFEQEFVDRRLKRNTVVEEGLMSMRLEGYIVTMLAAIAVHASMHRQRRRVIGGWENIIGKVVNTNALGTRREGRNISRWTLRRH